MQTHLFSLGAHPKDNIISIGGNTIEDRKIRLQCILRLDSFFWTPKDLKIKLRSQIDSDLERGYVLYNGHRLTRDDWIDEENYYGPPRIIRLHGRSARENYDERNTYPLKLRIFKGWRIWTRTICDACGGRLVYDHTRNLYCEACGITCINNSDL